MCVHTFHHDEHTHTHRPTPHPLLTHISWHTVYTLINDASNQSSPSGPHEETGHEQSTGHH